MVNFSHIKVETQLLKQSLDDAKKAVERSVKQEKKDERAREKAEDAVKVMEADDLINIKLVIYMC